MKKKKLYGKTFLTRPIGNTSDIDKVEKSVIVYGQNKDGTYSTSVMGILNGLIFNPFGTVLVVDVTKTEPREIEATYFRKKWW